MLERRQLPRNRNVHFYFESPAGSVQLKAQDASTQAARFPMADDHQIANANGGNFRVGSVEFHIQKMQLQYPLDRNNCLILAYSASRLKKGDRLASYEIDQFMGAGQSAETYKAHRIGHHDPVVLKIPNLAPNLGASDAIERLAKLLRLFMF